MLGEAPPFATLFGDIQNRIEDLKAGESHIAALNREAMGDLLVLGFADFHGRIIPEYVLTGSSQALRVDFFVLLPWERRVWLRSSRMPLRFIRATLLRTNQYPLLSEISKSACGMF